MKPLSLHFTANNTNFEWSKGTLGRARECYQYKSENERLFKTMSLSTKANKNHGIECIKFPQHTAAFQVNNSLLSVSVPPLPPCAPQGEQEANRCTPPSLHPACTPDTWSHLHSNLHNAASCFYSHERTPHSGPYWWHQFHMILCTFLFGPIGCFST